MANIGSADRTIRFVIGFLLIVLPFIAPTASWFAPLGNWTWVVVAVGIVMVVTAALRICPAYAVFGITSCPRK
jgi:membrane protein YdbS with pleckstrin-like domain